MRMGEEEEKGFDSEVKEKEEEVNKDIQNLEKSLQEALRKNDEYLFLLQRLQADFENYKKRMVREREELVNLAEAELVSQLLPLMDNFEIALLHEKNEVLSMLYSQLKKMLFERGLEEIENALFDPYYHEAVATASDPEKPEDAIIEVLKKGYRFKGSIIRHSQVVVNSAKM